MPSIQHPLGALPARFRRQRILLVGCGDVGLRVARRLSGRVRLMALTSSVARVESFRAEGIVPIVGNLDQARSLRRLGGLAHRVVHLAPPAAVGNTDPRTQALLAALVQRALPKVLLYGSTSGVYGDCAGEWVPETRATQANTPRAQRRVHAENSIRCWAHDKGVTACVLRIPGIYAADRDEGTPRTRLLKGLPVLQAAQDVYTNHIHADDLARACIVALWRGAPQRVYNICDDTQMKMGDYFDLAAHIMRLPKPPRVSLAEAGDMLSPMQLSFMGESRRLRNARMKQELQLRLQYPSVHVGLA
ncbi:MAG: NAD(P)-dependent oxidoreductase [Burkholderiales bacterium PBB4]|nr:MAG: NAD(P)-dependent oxidoreductase [Burkholderiales bacterium PBB4]